MKMGLAGKGGQTVIMINEDTYISFGKEKQAKWIHLSYPVEKGGARGGELFKPDMTGLSTEAKKVIGKDNLKVLKNVFKEHTEEGLLNLKDIAVIGAKIDLKGK